MPSLVVGTNTYVTEAQADAYLGDSVNGTQWTALTSTQKCQHLISAFRLLELQRWAGTKTVDTQTAQWPRTGVTCNGEAVDPNTVPTRIENGQIELANAIVLNPNLLTSPTGTTTAGIKRARAGSAEVEYFRNNPSSRILGNQRFPVPVQELIGCFLAGTPVSASALATGTDGESQFDQDQYGTTRGYY